MSATIAASIIASHSTAVAVLTIGTSCGAGPTMNACWIAGTALLFAPIAWAVRISQRSRP